MKKSFVRIWAASVLISFTINCISLPAQGLAAPAVPFSDVGRIQQTIPFGLDLPQSLGKIETIHSGTGPVVIHIQEAHGSYEGQKKIHQILRYLKERYGIKRLFLEGTAFKLHRELLQLYPGDSNRTMKDLDRLAKKSLVSGPEFLMAQDPDWQVYGIEETQTYRANSRAFVQVLRQKEQTEKFTQSMNDRMKSLAGPYLNSSLRMFLERSEDYESRRLTIEDWILFLKSQASKVLGADFHSPLQQKDWPMLLRIFMLKKIEAAFDKAQFEKERPEFFKALQRFLPRGGDLNSRISKILSEPFSNNQLPNPETGFLFEEMVSKLPRDFNYALFPQVNRFIGHLILKSELDGPDLVAEIEALQDMIASALAKTPQEKTILRLFKQQLLLKKLFSLELTPEDYEKVLLEAAQMDPRVLAENFLRLNEEKHVRAAGFDHLDEITALYREALEFYRLAKVRDGKMLAALETRLHENGESKAVVITGGFHSHPFGEYFKKQGYSYALITPQMTEVLGHDVYVKLFLENFLDAESPKSALKAVPYVASTDSEMRRLDVDPDAVLRKMTRVLGNQEWRPLRRLNTFHALKVPVLGLMARSESRIEDWEEAQSQVSEIKQEVEKSLREVIAISLKSMPMQQNSEYKELLWHQVAFSLLWLSHITSENILEPAREAFYGTEDATIRGAALKAMARVNPAAALSLLEKENFYHEGLDTDLDLVQTAVHSVVRPGNQLYVPEEEGQGSEIGEALREAGLLEGKREIVGQDREDIFRMMALSSAQKIFIELLLRAGDGRAFPYLKSYLLSDDLAKIEEAIGLAHEFHPAVLVPVLKAAVDKLQQRIEEKASQERRDLNTPVGWSAYSVAMPRYWQIEAALEAALSGDRNYGIENLRRWFEQHLKLYQSALDKTSEEARYEYDLVEKIARALNDLGESQSLEAPLAEAGLDLKKLLKRHYNTEETPQAYRNDLKLPLDDASNPWPRKWNTQHRTHAAWVLLRELDLKRTGEPAQATLEQQVVHVSIHSSEYPEAEDDVKSLISGLIDKQILHPESITVTDLSRSAITPEVKRGLQSLDAQKRIRLVMEGAYLNDCCLTATETIFDYAKTHPEKQIEIHYPVDLISYPHDYKGQSDTAEKVADLKFKLGMSAGEIPYQVYVDGRVTGNDLLERPAIPEEQVRLRLYFWTKFDEMLSSPVLFENPKLKIPRSERRDLTAKNIIQIRGTAVRSESRDYVSQKGFDFEIWLKQIADDSLLSQETIRAQTAVLKGKMRNDGGIIARRIVSGFASSTSSDALQEFDLMGLIETAAIYILDSELQNPNDADRLRSILKSLDQLISRYNKLYPESPRLSVPLAMILPLSIFFREAEEEAFIKLRSRLHLLPDSYGLDAVAFDLMLTGMHLRADTQMSDYADIERILPNFEFALQQLENGSLEKDLKAYLEFSVLKFILTIQPFLVDLALWNINDPENPFYYFATKTSSPENEKESFWRLKEMSRIRDLVKAHEPLVRNLLEQFQARPRSFQQQLIALQFNFFTSYYQTLRDKGKRASLGERFSAFIAGDTSALEDLPSLLHSEKMPAGSSMMLAQLFHSSHQEYLAKIDRQLKFLSKNPDAMFASPAENRDQSRWSPWISSATESMRFMDLYRRLYDLKDQYRSLPGGAKVVVAGPGYSEVSPGKFFSPQMLELIAVLRGLPGIHFMIYDREPEVVTTAIHPEIYRFDRTKEDLTGFPRLRDDLMEIMTAETGVTDREYTTFQVDSNKIKDIPLQGRVEEFEKIDYGEAQTDLFIGTVSLLYAFKDKDVSDNIALLGGIVKSLRLNGRLFMEPQTFGAIFKEFLNGRSTVDRERMIRARIPMLSKALSQTVGAEIEISIHGEIIEILKKENFKVASGSRAESRIISQYEIGQFFGEERVGPTLSGGRNDEFLYKDGAKVGIHLPGALFVFRALDEEGKEIPNRVYKITHYMNQNEQLYVEAQNLWRLQNSPASGYFPKIIQIGSMKSGGMWVEQESIPSARTLDREIFGRVSRLFEVLIRAAEIVESVHQQGLVHADLKPGQFLINSAQELQLIDFGNARPIHSHDDYQPDGHTIGYVPIDRSGSAIVRDLAEDTDAYSFIVMIAQLLDQQVKVNNKGLASHLKQMYQEYLELIFESWSFDDLDELWYVGSPLSRFTPHARKDWPQSMAPVIAKLKSDLEIIRRAETRNAMASDHAGPPMKVVGWDREMDGNHLATNENVTNLIKALEGYPKKGAYLGLGSFHNLDLALDQDAEAIVLVDYDEILMRFLNQLLTLIAGTEFKDIHQALAESGLDKTVKNERVETPRLWLSEESRYRQLQELIRKGNVLLIGGDITSPETSAAIQDWLTEKKVTIRRINLSNAPTFISSRKNLPQSIAQTLEKIAPSDALVIEAVDVGPGNPREGQRVIVSGNLTAQRFNNRVGALSVFSQGARRSEIRSLFLGLLSVLADEVPEKIEEKDLRFNIYSELKGRDRKSVDRFIRSHWGPPESLPKNFDILTAFYKGRIAGVYFFNTVSSFQANGKGIHVVEAFRRRGIGTILRKKLFNLLRDRGISRFYIPIEKTVEAQAFFGKLIGREGVIFYEQPRWEDPSGPVLLSHAIVDFDRLETEEGRPTAEENRAESRAAILSELRALVPEGPLRTNLNRAFFEATRKSFRDAGTEARFLIGLIKEFDVSRNMALSEGLATNPIFYKSKEDLLQKIIDNPQAMALLFSGEGRRWILRFRGFPYVFRLAIYSLARDPNTVKRLFGSKGYAIRPLSELKQDLAAQLKVLSSNDALTAQAKMRENKIELVNRFLAIEFLKRFMIYQDQEDVISPRGILTERVKINTYYENQKMAQSLQDLSLAVLQTIYDINREDLIARYGEPDSKAAIVLGGSHSRFEWPTFDFDAIFVYEKEGNTRGGPQGSLSHQDFYNQLAVMTGDALAKMGRQWDGKYQTTLFAAYAENKQINPEFPWSISLQNAARALAMDTNNREHRVVRLDLLIPAAGDSGVADQFIQSVQRELEDEQSIRKALIDLYQQVMTPPQVIGSRVDIKERPGGLRTIHYVIWFARLLKRLRHESVGGSSDTMNLIDELFPDEIARKLKAYFIYIINLRFELDLFYARNEKELPSQPNTLSYFLHFRKTTSAPVQVFTETYPDDPSEFNEDLDRVFSEVVALSKAVIREQLRQPGSPMNERKIKDILADRERKMQEADSPKMPESITRQIDVVSAYLQVQRNLSEVFAARVAENLASNNRKEFERLFRLATQRFEVRPLLMENHLPVPAAEGTSAFRFIEALQLDRALDVEPLSPVGSLKIFRIRIPEPTNLGVPADGLEILRLNLSRGNSFELLYNEKNQLIAIFPSALEAQGDTFYFDLSDYYPAWPQPGAAGVLAEWDAYRKERQISKDAIARYINERKFSDKNLYRKWYEQEPFILAELDPKTGTPNIGHFDPEEFFKTPEDEDRADEVRKLREKIIHPNTNRDIILYMSYPTVYSPGAQGHAYADQATLRDIYKEAQATLKENQVDWDDATGSGIIAWIKFRATQNLKNVRRLASDYNALAVANAKHLADVAGFSLETALSDTTFGQFPFLNTRVDFATSNSPAYAKTPSPGVVKREKLMVTGLPWDSDFGGLYLRGLAKIYAQVLSDSGTGLIWEVLPSSSKGEEMNDIRHFFESEDLQTEFVDDDGLDGDSGDQNVTIKVSKKNRSESRKESVPAFYTEGLGHRVGLNSEMREDFLGILSERIGTPRERVGHPIRFADFGTGNGQFVPMMKNYLEALGYQSEGYGIDTKRPETAEASVPYVWADLEKLEEEAPQLEAGSFDLITMNAPQLIERGVRLEKLYLIPGKFEAWLTSAKRLLSEKGVVLIRLYEFLFDIEADDSLSAEWMLTESVMLKRILDADSDLEYQEFTHTSTPHLPRGVTPVGPLILVTKKQKTAASEPVLAVERAERRSDRSELQTPMSEVRDFANVEVIARHFTGFLILRSVKQIYGDAVFESLIRKLAQENGFNETVADLEGLPLDIQSFLDSGNGNLLRGLFASRPPEKALGRVIHLRSVKNILNKEISVLGVEILYTLMNPKTEYVLIAENQHDADTLLAQARDYARGKLHLILRDNFKVIAASQGDMISAVKTQIQKGKDTAIIVDGEADLKLRAAVEKLPIFSGVKVIRLVDDARLTESQEMLLGAELLKTTNEQLSRMVQLATQHVAGRFAAILIQVRALAKFLQAA